MLPGPVARSYRVVCAALGQQTLTVTVGNRPSPGLPNPRIETASVVLHCEHVHSLVLAPAAILPPHDTLVWRIFFFQASQYKLANTYRSHTKDVASDECVTHRALATSAASSSGSVQSNNAHVLHPVLTGQTLALRLQLFSASGRVFDNASTANIQWNTGPSGNAASSLVTLSLPHPPMTLSVVFQVCFFVFFRADFFVSKTHTGRKCVIGVHVGVATVLVHVTGYSVAPEPEFSLSAAPTLPTPVRGSLLLDLVHAHAALPVLQTLLNHPQARGSLGISNGSGVFTIGTFCCWFCCYCLNKFFFVCLKLLKKPNQRWFHWP